ncbi:GtrA family protein [Massilia endophytica]|uniref:GtrA family protein n=1 Tax=Massilia endophytica TaxID=2899220 RepID=UPI001E5CB15A|nr:GtrA family protein [Massilia endophytica]UGQ46559.1 GtrA family protein [Massilia endophytica]
MSRSLPASAAASISLRSGIAFILVGGCATALHYLTAFACVVLFAVPVLAASGIGFVLSAAANYLANARFTFRSAAAHRSAAPRFAIVACSGLALNSILLAQGMAAGLGAVPAQILATIGVLIWNYLASALWTFRRRRQ